MSLPPSPVPRQRLHQCSITYEGYRRDDGLFDIDARLVDAKDHDFELLTGVPPAQTTTARFTAIIRNGIDSLDRTRHSPSPRRSTA